MTLEIVAPIALVSIAVVVLVYTQVIAPRRNRRAVAAALGGRGWLPVGPDEAPGWAAVAKLAVERAAGKARDFEFDEKAGPFTVHARRREQRSGKTLALFRDAGATQARYAATAVHQERTRSDSFGRHDRHTYECREFWIGEARRLPIEAPKAVFRWTAELMREAAAPIALARERNPDDIPTIASPPRDRLSDGLRAVLAETDLARTGKITLLVAPDAWVITAPLDTSAQRVEEFVALTSGISAVFDRWQPGR